MCIHFAPLIQLPGLLSVVIGILLCFAGKVRVVTAESATLEILLRPFAFVIALYVTHENAWSSFFKLSKTKTGYDFEVRLREYWMHASRRSTADPNRAVRIILGVYFALFVLFYIFIFLVLLVGLQAMLVFSWDGTKLFFSICANFLRDRSKACLNARTELIHDFLTKRFAPMKSIQVIAALFVLWPWAVGDGVRRKDIQQTWDGEPFALGNRDPLTAFNISDLPSFNGILCGMLWNVTAPNS